MVAVIVLNIAPTAAHIVSILAPAISIVITVLAIETIPVAAIPEPTKIAPTLTYSPECAPLNSGDSEVKQQPQSQTDLHCLTQRLMPQPLECSALHFHRAHLQIDKRDNAIL